MDHASSGISSAPGREQYHAEREAEVGTAQEESRARASLLVLSGIARGTIERLLDADFMGGLSTFTYSTC